MRKTILICFLLSYFNKNEAQVIDSNTIHRMESAVRDSVYPNIHAILIWKDNQLLYEHYFPGRDKKNGKDLGVIPHAADSLHGIQSITKSIVSACVGIAIDQGKLKGVEQKIIEFFQEYAFLNVGLKSELTIKDLLTMTAGFQWNEENYNDTTNSEHQMDISPDPVRYVLSLPIVSKPGQSFNYCAGTTQVLAAIVEKAAGMPIDQFAQEYLFTPLDIHDYEWTSCTGSNQRDAFSGLYMRPGDLLKFGLLYVNNGLYNSKQVISAAWVKQSLTPFMVVDDGTDPLYGKSEYGFQWWLLPDTVNQKPITIAACIGNGGQRIFVDQVHQVVVVFTAGNYRRPDLYLMPYTMLHKFIYPALF